MGLIVIRLVFKNLSDNLLQLLAVVFGEKLFTNANISLSGFDLIKVSKVFDLKNAKYLKITNELKKEHCCFLHFLLGKKRNMSKRNDLEVFLQARNREKQTVRRRD